MEKNTLYNVLAAILIATIVIIACELPVDPDCGPFKDRFMAVDFKTQINRITCLDTLHTDIQFMIMDTDTFSFDEFAITMYPVAEYYFSNRHSNRLAFFISNVYACSPIHPSSDEVIRDIRIYSDRNFNEGYPAGENLAEMFDVIVLYYSSLHGYRRYDLREFLLSEHTVPDEMNFVLTSQPEYTDRIQFTIEYEMHGLVLEYYEVTTDPIVLTGI